MKILLIGKTGQLGSQLLHDIPKSGHTVVAPPKQYLNILDEDELSFTEELIVHEPDIIINTAAFNNLLLCESLPHQAFQLNSIAVKKMAEIANTRNIWFVTFSTNYIFDGTKKQPYTENDTPKPLQTYGITKLAGEHGALIYNKSIIIRTSTLYGSQHTSLEHTETSKPGNFIDSRIEDSIHSKQIEVSNEQTVSSTYIPDLSKAIIQLITHPQTESGIYHLTNEGYHTWYELTKEIFNILNIDTEVIPVDRNGRTENMKRPLFSALENTKAKRLNITLPHWKDALRIHLTQHYGSRN